MAKTGRLQYDCMDGSTTTITWFTDVPTDLEYAWVARVEADGGTVEAIPCVEQLLLDLGWEPTDIVDFCGTADPLKINWNGGRYDVTIPSSATISLMVETLEQRQFLEPIFNGGWYVDIHKDGEPYWKGKLTPTLNIEQYRTYPYPLSLNANDGMAKAKDRQMLMVDFPEPWPNKVSMMEFIVKMINQNFYPNTNFKLNISSNLYFGIDNLTQFETTYVDPLVFMDSENAQYLSNEDVLNSFLGIYALKLFQWKQEWYIVSEDAQWNAGSIRITSYSVEGDSWTYLGFERIELGLLDLYSCDFDTGVQVGNNAQISFISPWQSVTLTQSFQMNSNILPAFANRSGNFYQGDESTYLEFYPAPVQDRLRHWTNNGLIALPYYNIPNQGSLLVPVVEPETRTDEYAYVDHVLDDDLQFSQFTFAINSQQTYDNLPQGDNVNKGIKRVVEIKYTDTSNRTWNFWYNPDTNVESYEWADEGVYRQLDFDENNLSFQFNMPGNLLFQGGTFRFAVYNAVVDLDDYNRYGMLYSGIELGIVSEAFQNIPASSNAFRVGDRFTEDYYRAATFAIVTAGLGVLAMAAIDIKKIRAKKKARRESKAVGGIIQDKYSSQTIDWNDDVKVNINPLADTASKFEYVWGINLLSIDSYHDIHLSSPYDVNGDAQDYYLNDINVDQEGGQFTNLDLTTWRHRAFSRDNTEYTTQLTGTWRSPQINPLQLVYDFEGRVYKFTKGTWNDKAGTWSNVYTEFKALYNVAGQPIKGDYSPYDYNDDYFTETPA